MFCLIIYTSSSRSGSESPKKEDVLEFISEFKNDSNAETSDDEGIPDVIPDIDRFKRTKGSSPLDAKRLSLSSATVPSPSARPSGLSSGSSSINPTKGAADMKLSLVEKLKQRMRQGLDSGKLCHVRVYFYLIVYSYAHCTWFLNWKPVPLILGYSSIPGSMISVPIVFFFFRCMCMCVCVCVSVCVLGLYIFFSFKVKRARDQ